MILYFSGTGNSKYCAKTIADKLNEKLVSINLNMMNDINEIDMTGETRLGIVAPTYDYDLAWTVREYLEGLTINNISDDVYTFGIITCGGNTSGKSAKTLENTLKNKGIKLNYNATVPMSDNYILLYKLDTSKNDIKMENANKLLEEIIKKIEAKENNKVKLKFGSSLLASFSKPYIRSQKSTKNFKVSEECIGCGLCSKVCPKNIITMKDDKPVWSDKDCSCCLSCINRCPKRAISKGSMSIKNEHYYNKLVDPDMK